VGTAATRSRLGVLARPTESADAPERCQLCAAPLPDVHRHLLELGAGRLACACRACAMLFDRRAAGGGRYRLVPDRTRTVVDAALDDGAWRALGVPVEAAFFLRSTAAGRVLARYPSPLGATEWVLEPAAWATIEAANPVLARLEADVEALLVNRLRGARDHWLAPLDVCYALVGLVRTRWKGLGGGSDVWAALDRFFAALRAGAIPVARDGRPWPTTTGGAHAVEVQRHGG
jgi:hypothetical protein